MILEKLEYVKKIKYYLSDSKIWAVVAKAFLILIVPDIVYKSISSMGSIDVRVPEMSKNL